MSKKNTPSTTPTLSLAPSPYPHDKKPRDDVFNDNNNNNNNNKTGILIKPIHLKSEVISLADASLPPASISSNIGAVDAPDSPADTSASTSASNGRGAPGADVRRVGAIVLPNGQMVKWSNGDSR